ncbi:MAG: RHS repeat-associated core domain-containing protein [Gammaproteobacteria bacterium]|nr:RHS repeat-associated core domain-containing protein [Gammaproteobacteria bacterium]
MLYNYFRDYDPATGRYVQSDPIGLRGGLNTYVYALNNPLIFKDIRGLEVYPDPDDTGGSRIQGCCDGKEQQIMQDVQNACAIVASQIKNPKLAQCILNRCRNAIISCEKVCWSVGYNWIFSSTAHICVNDPALDWFESYGCIAIHEWAHSCGWDHNQGGGVPGNSGLIDWKECINIWNSGSSGAIKR